jgi:diacylglycerol O-acyltransferase / wax synthase
MSTGERLSGADRAWLLMDRPATPMTIVGLLILEGRLERARLRELLAERLLRFARFRCVPVADALGAQWVEAEHFDLDDHVISVALPSPATQTELEALVGELSSTPFNPGRPLWTYHLVERYGRGSAVIARIHHCYADGIALMRVLLSLADTGSRPAPPPAVPAEETSGGFAGLQALAGLAPAPIAATLRGGTELIESGLGYLLHPLDAATAAWDALGYTVELVQVATLADDPATRLKQTLSGAQHVAWAEPLSLEEVRTVAHALGCTVNDVLVSTLAGALGRYLASEGDEVTGLTLRAVVPVNLRPESEPLTLGNRFGMVFIELPIGIRQPLARLDAVHSAMQQLKGSTQAAAVLGLLSVVGSLPSPVADTATAIFSAKASLVVSNLPGPREKLRLGGIPLRQFLFWVPHAGSIGTGVSILTYRGAVQFGVIADRQTVAHPDRLVELIGAEFERLLLLVLLGAAALSDAGDSRARATRPRSQGRPRRARATSSASTASTAAHAAARAYSARASSR